MKLTLSDKKVLLAEYERNRYKYFVPNGAVERFISAVGTEINKRIFLFSAANAVGKTSGVINILANIIYPNKNRYFQYPRFESWDLPKNIWYSSEHTTLKETVGPEIEKWFPFRKYILTRSQEYPVSLVTENGWRIDFKRYDQDPRKFESATISIAVFDEPPPEQIYNAVISRLRMGGIILMPMTPLFGSAYVKDKIVENNAYAYVQFAEMEENCKTHGVRGILNHDDIEFMISQMEPEQRDARVKGKFMFLSGLVFKEFDRAIHVISVDQIERLWLPSVVGKFEEWPKVMVADPHTRRPDAIIWAALAPDGTWIVYDEYPDANFYQQKSRTDDIKMTLKKCHDKEQGITEKEWKALHGEGSLRVIRRVMDRRMGGQNVSDSGMTLRDVYIQRSRDIGWPISIEPSYDDKNRVDHSLIHEVLRFSRDSDGIITRPKLVILRDCKNTIYCFERYSWDDWEGKAGDKKAIKELVKDKYADYIDCVRYMLGENISYERVVPKRKAEGTGYDVRQKNWMAA